MGALGYFSKPKVTAPLTNQTQPATGLVSSTTSPGTLDAQGRAVIPASPTSMTFDAYNAQQAQDALPPPPTAPAATTPGEPAAAQDISGYMPPSGPAAAPAAAAAPSTVQGAFESALNKLLTGKTPQEAGMDVMNGPAVQAFNANTKRQEARDRQLIAERATAQGYGDSGGLESEILGLRARGSEAMNRYAGEQASTAEQGRREELLQALSLALTFGDNNAARQIQRELGLGQIGAQNYATSTGRENQLDRLGFDYADLEQRANQAALEYYTNGGLT